MAKDKFSKIKTDPESLAKGLSNLIKAKLENTENIPDLTKKEKTYKAGESVEWEINKPTERDDAFQKAEKIVDFKEEGEKEREINEKKEKERKRLANEFKKALRNKDKEKIRDLYIRSAGIKEPDPFELAKQKVLDNIEKNTEENFKNFDEKIDAAYDRTEKVAKEVEEKFNKQIQDLKNKIDSGFKEPKTEKERTIEEDLNHKRTEYAEGYKKFLADRKKEASWYLNLSRKIFGSKIKEEDTPKFLKDLEQEYEKATILFGKKMYAEKEEELKRNQVYMKIAKTGEKNLIGGPSDEEVKAELKRYKANEIFTKIIIEEQSKLNALKVENLPVKEKALWKKALDLYSKQWFDESKSKIKWKNRAAKIAVTTLLTTGIVAFAPSGASLGAGALASYAGTKLARGIAGSITGQTANQIFEYSTKAYNWLFNKKTSTERRAEQEKELAKIFAEDSFDTSFAKNKKEYSEIIERERKAKRERLITKSLITLAAGGLASYGMGSLAHGLSPEQANINENLTQRPNIHTGNTPVNHEQLQNQNIQNETIGKINSNETSAIKTEEIKNIPKGTTPEGPKIKTEFKIEEVKISSKGAIQTIENLKEKIRTDYPDISKAPASVQEFMRTNSTEEAIKLGFYNPNSPSESAMLLKGSTLGFDEHGNLTVHDIKTGKDSILIQGEGNKPRIEQYHGQMFDSDQNTHNIDNNIPDDQNPYALPPQEDALNNNAIEQNNINTQSEYAVPQQEDAIVNSESMISPEIKINQTYSENINYLFGDKNVLWENLKDSHAPNLTADKMINYSITDGTNEDTKKLVNYLNKLHEVTGLNPIEKTLINPAETNSEYILRAIQKASEMGELDKVKL